MSIIKNADSILITNFSGANQLQDEEEIRPPEAISCQNVEFVDGSVQTRRGFGVAWTAGRSITSMWNWIQDAYNRLLFLDRTASAKWCSKDLSTLVVTDVLTSGIGSPVGIVNAPVGFRTIATFFDATTHATTEGRIWDGTITNGTPNVEKLFPHAPVLGQEVAAFSFSEPGAGVMTAGLHYFAVIITTWNGAETPPGPIDPGSTSYNVIFLPQAFTCSGSKNLRIAITNGSVTTWPLSYATAQIAMTPAVNPNRWFIVPGSSTTIPRLGSGIIGNPGIIVNITDLALLADGNNEITSGLVNSPFNLFPQAPDSTGPFDPHFALPFGDRMVYGTRIPDPATGSIQGAMFVSDPAMPQSIYLASSLLQLPGFNDIISGGVLGATLYAFGPNWTYAYSDNRRTPVGWAPPRTISLSLGSHFIKGVTTNIARQIMWVCSEVGLYAFNGAAYDIRPSSYKQGTSDWFSINWNAPADTLEVVDYPDQRIVVVKAPLGSTQQTANYLMVWDYSQGYDADSIRYCGKWWLNTTGGTQIQIGSIANVNNPTNNLLELWVSSQSASVTGKVYRQKFIPTDASSDPLIPPTALYNDDGAGIDSKIRPASPVSIDQPLFNQLGIAVRDRGQGTHTLSAYSTDQTNPESMASIQSAWKPGKTYLRLLDKQSPSVNYEISNGAQPGFFFILSALRCYFRKWLEQGNS